MPENRKKLINNHEDLEVYKIAFNTAMTIFEISKNFPNEEKYSLIDQIRRSSRSVCASFSRSMEKKTL
jgi:four helix bundle protein